MKIAKKSIAILLALIMSVTCFSLIAFAEEPAVQAHLAEVPEGYVGIYTKGDLDNIKLDLTGKYILMNDIVFYTSDYEKGGNFYNSGKGWEPIGTESTKFRGTFDGNGYAIKNLYINNPEKDNVGLFGYVHDANINNLTLINIDIIGRDHVGGVVGYSYANSMITYCNTQGVVTGNCYVGGIVGYQLSQDYTKYYGNDYCYNKIQYCNNSAKISATAYCGGITGVSSSFFNSTLTGCAYVKYCSNSGDVNAINSSAGGIVGLATCLAGRPRYGETQFTTFCYNCGDVSALSYAGGLIGRCMSSGHTRADDSYSVGTVTAETYIGGCFGESPFYTTSCYYLSESVLNPTCTDGVSKNADEMRESTTFEKWNFKNTWTMGGREDYPYPELIGVPLMLPEDYENHEHSYSSEITTPATHLATGVMTYTCDCGETYTEVIEKIAEHSYTANITDPTCTEKGYTTYTCECGDIYIRDYKGATGHDYDSGVVTTKPTCTKSGIKTFTCGNCGDTYTEDVEALGHGYTSEITTPATHLTEGVETFTCVVCGDSYTEVIEKIAEHDYESVVTAPNCTAQGYTTYTCECGDSYVDDYVDALGHTNADAVEENYVAPTCAENGSKDVVVYCSVCDAEISRETVVINATGHSYTTDVTNPTCTEQGYTTYTCSCGDSYVDDYVNATGHADNDGDGHCDMDNEVIDSTVNCDCNCHKSGISKFFFNFILFFQKIFGSNKTCACGVAHY